MLEITAVTRVVDVYAVVTDSQGRLVSGLRREQFELREDGERQALDYFARETDAPLSLGLVVDTSASQAGLLLEERASARSFLASVLDPSDQAFVMRFDREVSVLQGLTADASALGRALDGLRADVGGSAAPRGGPRGTRLYDAIHQASSELLHGQRGRKVLVLVTDGEDQGSRVSRREALEAAERAEVIVYSVLAADPAFYWARGRDFTGDAGLASLLRKTGGWLVRSGAEAAAGLETVAAELRAQYRLGYVPQRGYDGSYRRIDVRVRGGRYGVRARRGYFASAE